jgi:AmmeMemoRadiSam system protein B
MQLLLRHDLEIRVVELEGEKSIVLRCPLGLSASELILSIHCAAALNLLLQGCTRDVLVSQSGLSHSHVTELLELLSLHFLLSGPQFQEAFESLRSRFASAPKRELAFQGSIYEANPVQLRSSLERGLASPKKLSSQAIDGINPRILIVPHIDYQRGFPAYAAGYHLVQQTPCDLIILMGTSHQGGMSLFQFLDKNYDTPFGEHPLDVAALELVLSRYGKQRGLQDQFLHRSEHSLELQVPFTGHMFKGVPVLPILVGSFYPFLGNPSGIVGTEEYEAFVDGFLLLLQNMRELNKRVLIIAGVDMAHIGPVFGDRDLVSEQICESVRQRDVQYLQCLQTGSSQDLWNHVASDADARRICGFPTLFSLMDIFERRGSRRLVATDYCYEQALSKARDCLVSFSALLLGLPSMPANESV